jgi:hypothetical protein
MVVERFKTRVCGLSLAGITGLNPAGGMDVSVVCCVSSGRGLCHRPIPRPEESYQLWCVIVCHLETSKNEVALARVGLLRQRKRY